MACSAANDRCLLAFHSEPNLSPGAFLSPVGQAGPNSQSTGYEDYLQVMGRACPVTG